MLVSRNLWGFPTHSKAILLFIHVKSWDQRPSTLYPFNSIARRKRQNLLQFIRKLSEAADLSALMKNLHCASSRNDANVGLSPLFPLRFPLISYWIRIFTAERDKRLFRIRKKRDGSSLTKREEFHIARINDRLSVHGLEKPREKNTVENLVKIWRFSVFHWWEIVWEMCYNISEYYNFQWKIKFLGQKRVKTIKLLN